MYIYKVPSQMACHTSAGRASVFTSMKGSITLEAAAAVPIFFFAVLCLLFLMEIMAVQTAVRSGLQYAGKQAAAKAYPVAALMPGQIESDVVNAIGAERLERSIVEGGIDCSGSRMSARTGVAELSAVYRVRIPLPIFQIPLLEYEQTMRIKGWTGYEKTGFGSEGDETVYVTETGLVYHTDYHCSHLELSIRMVNRSEVGEMRNESGGKYHACERCGRSGAGGVYITDTGDRYHGTLSCSGLKRTVYAVPVSEVIGKGACSRCGK
ncbi:MAG TPA: pilus assembly protein [Candidatus Dorea gallistercoris]|uniref:Pilus assembly protein n=1 Tax=Candidatus Dorea gallistercoris TaxID=2838542 RepID=A0A9D1UDA4_9FIRM|nr:pilus assembly protein [Candidatus Dorea gallistercoris]